MRGHINPKNYMLAAAQVTQSVERKAPKPCGHGFEPHLGRDFFH